jgi:hypothetical protein
LVRFNPDIQQLVERIKAARFIYPIEKKPEMCHYWLMTSGFDKEKTKEIISLVLEKIKTEVDLRTLREYQSLFKKETSLFNRSMTAAYLLMLCDQGKTINLKDYKRTLPSGPGNRSDTQRHTLSDKESTRLFFSVGRSRRVFPREILGIINSKTAIPREDIGAIRILDNYSFVQVRDSVAEKIIEALNGMNFRGRPLTVNYAKSSKDEDITPTAASEQDLYDPKKEDDI